MNRKTLFTLLVLLFIILLTVAVTLIPEIIGQDMANWCETNLKPIFGEKYKYWLLGIVVFACVLLAFLTTEQGRALLSRSADASPIALTPEETQKNYDTIRQYLRQRYERRKDQKLAGDQLFNLRIKPTTEGTSPEKAETFVTLQGKKTGEEIQQIFEKARRRLLVTGLPGAGKTSLLLNLALELLETDPDHLAVLLNLATWRSDFPSFDDWLREILPAELGVTKRYAAEILQAGKLSLLLDGLDEVDEAHRASCLKAIGEYGRLGRDYVISARKDEYKALEKDAPVWAQIEVLPLTDKQLLAQLDHADRRDFPEAPDLKAALEHDPLLLRVAETPFYLNCLQLLFRGGSTLSELKLKGATVEERQAEITERFVEQALAQPNKHGTSEQVRHWLSFFASRLSLRNMVVFELVDLQYDWWRWGRFQILIAALIMEIFPALFVGILFGVLENSIGNYINSVSRVLILGLSLSALPTSWFFYLKILQSRIIKKTDQNNEGLRAELLEINRFRIAASLKMIRQLLPMGVFYGLIFWISNNFLHSLLIVSSLYLYSRIRKTYKNKNRLEILTKDIILFNKENMLFSMRLFSSAAVLFGIPSVFIFGIKIGVLIGVLSWLFLGLGNILINEYSFFLQITTPYQRFVASAKALHFSILQHWLLRWQLYRAGVLPLRLVHFLNEMTARHLLETDGATWRFRHRILQEYFAGQWRE